MPSTTFCLALFFSFICGQFLNALCASLSAPVHTVEVLTVVSGISVQSLVVVVLGVLVVHDLLVILIIRHLLQAATTPIRKNNGKILLLVVSRAVFEWRNNTQVPCLRIAARHGIATPRSNQFNPRRLLLGPTIPRPLRIILRTISCPLVPRIEYLTAPVLVITSVSRASTCHSRPCLGLPGPHAQAWQFVLGLLLALATATASRSADDVCHAFIEEVVEDDSVGTRILVLGSKAVVKTKIDAINFKPYGRSHPFYFPLLRHVSAAATLHQSPVRIVVEGARYAINEVSITPASGFGERVKVSRIGCFSYSGIGLQVPQHRTGLSHLWALAAARFQDSTCQAIEEVAEDDSENTLVVEGECKSTNVEEKVYVPALKPPAPSRPSHISLLLHLSSAATSRKQLGRVVVDEPCHATIEVVDNEITLVSDSGSLEETIDAVFVDEECDWEELPSYEEFAQGAPAEPLFEEKYISFAITHGVCRPPPLSALAARTGAKPPPQAPRASQLPLLSRLSVRLCKASALAEPFSPSV
ncbi:hypothetical protein B0H11DRAFT_1972173 [Mycena galericulata]|nr:hypothetical protein B0H11DRAFT_1972173 [Mycena galericulata]